MKRTTKIQELKESIKLIRHHFGGHLSYPPKDCQKKDLIIFYDEIPWLDLSVCHTCKIVKECSVRKIHLKQLKQLKEKK